jgi:hypothetical protein
MFGGLFLIILALGYLLPTLGFTVLAIWFWRKRSHQRTVAMVLAGISALLWGPIIFLMISAAATRNARMSDAQLFEHVLGFRSGLSHDQMMFDEYGDPRDGEIFMRVYPDQKLRSKILASNGLRPSRLTLEQFHTLGQRTGLLWWDAGECSGSKIYESGHAPKWQKIYVLDCPNFDALYGGEDALYAIFLKE